MKPMTTEQAGYLAKYRINLDERNRKARKDWEMNWEMHWLAYKIIRDAGKRSNRHMGEDS